MVEGGRFIVVRLHRYCTENCIKAVGTIREVLSLVATSSGNYTEQLSRRNRTRIHHRRSFNPKLPVLTENLSDNGSVVDS